MPLDEADSVGLAASHANMLNALGRYDQAERVARRALAGAPDDPRLLVELAWSLLKLGRPRAALLAADAVLAAQPGRPDGTALAIRALALAGVGRSPLAVRVARDARDVHPFDAYLAWVHAEMLRRTGRLEQARMAAEQAVELDPHWTASHRLLGEILGQLGKRREARRAFETALRLDPEHADSLRGLAKLERTAGRSIRAMMMAGRVDPKGDWEPADVARQLLQTCFLASIWLAWGWVPLLLPDLPVDQPSWTTRLVAAGILLASLLQICGNARGLPQRAWPVLRAASRGEQVLVRGVRLPDVIRRPVLDGSHHRRDVDWLRHNAVLFCFRGVHLLLLWARRPVLKSRSAERFAPWLRARLAGRGSPH